MVINLFMDTKMIWIYGIFGDCEYYIIKIKCIFCFSSLKHLNNEEIL